MTPESQSCASVTGAAALASAPSFVSVFSAGVFVFIGLLLMAVVELCIAPIADAQCALVTGCAYVRYRAAPLIFHHVEILEHDQMPAGLLKLFRFS